MAGAIAVSALLAGCTSSTTSELTLVATKSPVQLLRNDAVDRVETRFISEARNTSDISVACSTEAENPGGLIRQWESDAEIILSEGAHREYVAKRLVQSFTGDGWNDEDLGDGRTRISSDKSVASIEISSDDSSANGTVRIAVTGPCVTTDGPDSDEVKGLESD